MADLETLVRRPGLGILLLNAAAIGLLHATLGVFDPGASAWTRLAMLCLGGGAICGVLLLLVEVVVPSRFPLDPRMHRAEVRSIAAEGIGRNDRLAQGSFLAAAVLLVAAALIPWSWFVLLPVAALLAGGYFVYRMGRALRRLRESFLEDVDRFADEWAGAAERPEPREVELQPELQGVLLAGGFGLFALGVIAAVSQPFSQAVEGIACEAGYSAKGKCREEKKEVLPEPPSASCCCCGAAACGPRSCPAPAPEGKETGDGKEEDAGEEETPVPPGIVEPTGVLPADTLFPFGSAELGEEARPHLLRVADYVRRERGGRVVVVTGHTDRVGSARSNLALSRARAQSVADWLSGPGGLAEFPFEVRGRGASSPRAPDRKADGSDDPAARALNRRVEVTFAR